MLRFGNARADYDIARVEHDRVFIIDIDVGNKSVTDDAEFVYNELQSKWPGRRVIYKDRIGEWSEMLAYPSDNVLGIEIDFDLYEEHVPT